MKSQIDRNSAQDLCFKSLLQFAKLLAPLIAEELHATEQRQADARWAAQDLNTLKKQRTAAMRAEKLKGTNA